jgi:predicted SAM-dependent methyltransferase
MPFAYTLNVLEHIVADDAAARALYEVLRPGGRLLVYVPAFNLLYSSMDRRVGHHRRYRRRTLVPLLEAAGFAIESARYCDSLGFLAALAFKAIGNREGTIAPASVSLYDRVAFPLSRVLDRVTQRFFGKNILVVARRPA